MPVRNQNRKVQARAHQHTLAVVGSALDQRPSLVTRAFSGLRVRRGCARHGAGEVGNTRARGARVERGAAVLARIAASEGGRCALVASNVAGNRAGGTELGALCG